MTPIYIANWSYAYSFHSVSYSCLLHYLFYEIIKSFLKIITNKNSKIYNLLQSKFVATRLEEWLTAWTLYDAWLLISKKRSEILTKNTLAVKK